MRRFLELIEQKETIVFTFGRFNPPTTGHEKLIKKVASVAGSSPFRIYPSYSQNQKKDPLPFALKIAYMRKMFSKYARNIIADKDARTAINIAVKLYNEGFKNLTMIVGSDRVKEFSSLLNNYNGVEGKRHGFYKFDSINVVSAGERDPDAEGISGMSASKMRAAASDGDFDSFVQGVPVGFKDAKKLYLDVRKYMGIREERDMGEMNDFETLRDMYLTGKIWNIDDLIEAKGIEGKIIRRGTNYVAFNDSNGKVHKAWLHEITLNERNYASEYKNYHSRPEQIARRSSRNKARRIMGINAIKGLDVGHIDNNPMNNNPDNLRNEDPSDNRREPRLRNEKDQMKNYVKDIAHTMKSKGHENLKKYADEFEKNALKSLNPRKELNKIPNINPKQVANLLNMGEEVEINEIDIPSLIKNVVHRITHPKQYKEMIKDYIQRVGEDRPKKRHSNAFHAAEIARDYGLKTSRALIDYVNKLVSKGQLPQELKAEYKFTEFRNFNYKPLLNSWGEITEKDDKSGKELNNPTRGDTKKYKVYVKNDKGNVVKVEFGDPNMEIKRDDPARRKAFRARHNCDNPGPKWKAKYWSCKFWSAKSVTDLMKG